MIGFGVFGLWRERGGNIIDWFMIINCKMSRLLENGCCTRVLKLFVTGFYTYVLRVNLITVAVSCNRYKTACGVQFVHFNGGVCEGPFYIPSIIFRLVVSLVYSETRL